MIHPLSAPLLNTVYEWWSEHQWPALPQEILPSRSYMAFIGEKPILAGFLYKDETCGFSMLEWIVANPDSTQEEREEAFQELIDHVTQVAKEIGAKVLLTSTKNESLCDRFLKQGFQKTDTGMTYLIKGV